jgi:hypothetical protein
MISFLAIARDALHERTLCQRQSLAIHNGLNAIHNCFTAVVASCYYSPDIVRPPGTFFLSFILLLMIHDLAVKCMILTKRQKKVKFPKIKISFLRDHPRLSPFLILLRINKRSFSSPLSIKNEQIHNNNAAAVPSGRLNEWVLEYPRRVDPSDFVFNLSLITPTLIYKSSLYLSLHRLIIKSISHHQNEVFQS